MAPGVTRERAEAELTALLNGSPIVPAGALAAAGAFDANARTLARTTGLQEYGTESVRTGRSATLFPASSKMTSAVRSRPSPSKASVENPSGLIRLR